MDINAIFPKLYLIVDLTLDAINDFLQSRQGILSIVDGEEPDRDLDVVNFLNVNHEKAVIHYEPRDVPDGKRPCLSIGLVGDAGYFWSFPERYNSIPDGEIYMAHSFRPHDRHPYESYTVNVKWVARHTGQKIPNTSAVNLYAISRR